MKGFPEIIATKEDFENLLNDENFKEEALLKLQELQDHDDRTVTIATEPIDQEDPESEWNVEEIENPLPVHKQKGFSEWLDVVRLNSEAQGTKVSELCEKYSQTEIESAVVVLT